MLVEFRVVPMGQHRSEAWRDRVGQLVKASGLPFEQGLFSFCMEGKWTQVMDVVHRCHQAGFEFSSQVMTSITINDFHGAAGVVVEATQDDLGRRVPRKGMDAEC